MQLPEPLEAPDLKFYFISENEQNENLNKISIILDNLLELEKSYPPFEIPGIIKNSSVLIKFNKYDYLEEKWESNINDLMTLVNYDILNSKAIENEAQKHLFFENPCSLLERGGNILEKGNFCPKLWKSNESCSFNLKFDGFGEREETFVAFPGYIKDPKGENNKYPLIIYNLSTDNKIAVLSAENTNGLCIVSTFPKNGFVDSLDKTEISKNKKWIYTADVKGIVRIYEIKIENNDLENEEIDSSITVKNKNFSPKFFPVIVNCDHFKEIHQIDCKNKIESMIIFYDKFNEINRGNYEIYAIISFYDFKLPLIVYKYDDIEKKNNQNKKSCWEVFRNIHNPIENTCCYTMNFYHDFTINETCLFFGFKGSIKEFNLKKMDWKEREFTKGSCVSSINFLFKKTDLSLIKKEYCKVEKYLIYTCWNRDAIFFCNLESKKSNIDYIKLENCLSINDLCIWNCIQRKNEIYDEKIFDKEFLNRNYLISATLGKNTNNRINIIDFDEKIVVKSRILDESQKPINLIKIKISNLKDIELKLENEKNILKKESLMILEYSGIDGSEKVSIFK